MLFREIGSCPQCVHRSALGDFALGPGASGGGLEQEVALMGVCVRHQWRGGVGVVRTCSRRSL